jgi:glucose/arabinose dehydrogenase
VNIAPAKGWPHGATPVAASGLTVHALAQGLDHPRWLYVLPNGDVLVAETDTPPTPDDNKGVKGWIAKQVMAKAGSGDHSANRITLLRDADGRGVAVTRTVFLEGLNSPFGMTLVGNQFYVADTDAVLRFDYVEGATHISTKGTKVTDLPAGPHQPSLDQEPHSNRRWHTSLCHCRLEQQRGREWDRQRDRSCCGVGR